MNMLNPMHPASPLNPLNPMNPIHRTHHVVEDPSSTGHLMTASEQTIATWVFIFLGLWCLGLVSVFFRKEG